ncbi:hypothetical protein OBK03_10540 [Empedobacter falsenii]
MKKIYLFLALLANTFLFAQEKINIGILPFTNGTSYSGSAKILTIQEAVVDAFVKTRRFNIVDRSKLKEIEKEKKLQRSEDFIDGSVVRQGVSIGANFVVSGDITGISTEEEVTKLKDGTTSRRYYTKINMILKIIDVSTGQVITSENISSSGGSKLLGGLLGLGASTPEASYDNTLRAIINDVDSFVSRNFPLNFEIVEIVENDKNNNISKVLISGGSNFNIQKNDKLIIYELINVNVGGKVVQRKKEIGELKVIKVEDENFSICTIRKGEKEITNALNKKVSILVSTN